MTTRRPWLFCAQLTNQATDIEAAAMTRREARGIEKTRVYLLRAIKRTKSKSVLIEPVIRRLMLADQQTADAWLRAVCKQPSRKTAQYRKLSIH